LGQYHGHVATEVANSTSQQDAHLFSFVRHLKRTLSWRRFWQHMIDSARIEGVSSALGAVEIVVFSQQ
jgi:hypothetical protein